jgi:hypothetical protein
MMIACEDCGSRMYGGFCTNCDEEHFIADQYRSDGESVPLSIAQIEGEQIAKRQGQVSVAIDAKMMKRERQPETEVYQGEF